MMPQLPSDAEVDAYIQQKATIYGINPIVAMRVSQAERGNRSGGWIGDRGTSFGPFQLHKGGGLADVFKSQTGLNAEDIASTWRQQIDFSLSWASRNGWTDFHAAQALGYGTWDGISKAVGGAITAGLRYFFPVVGYGGDPKKTYHTPGASDLFAPLGTKVRSIADGRVSTTGTSGPGGNNIIITGLDGLDYYYAHLKDPVTLKAGDYVGAGQPIGSVGNTGNAAGTEPHLHLGIGYGISSGTGADGGTGRNFDAQTFLAGLLGAAGSGEDSEGILSNVAQSLTQWDIGQNIRTGFTQGFGDLQQYAQNYVQNRAASIVLVVFGVFMVLFALFQMIRGTEVGKLAIKGAGAAIGGIPGAAVSAAS